MTLTVTDPVALGFDARTARTASPSSSGPEYLDSGKLPHAAVLVSRAGEPALVSGGGRGARLASRCEEDAIFRIASMTKPITSVAFMAVGGGMPGRAGRRRSADVLPEWL